MKSPALPFFMFPDLEQRHHEGEIAPNFHGIRSQRTKRAERHSSKESQFNTEPITSYDRYVEIITQAVQQAVGLPTLGLSKVDIEALSIHVNNQNPDLVERRIKGLAKRLPANRDAFEYVVAGDLKGVLPKFRNVNQVQLRASAKVLLADLPLTVHTPEDYIPQPAPERELLTDRLLDEAFYYVVYSKEGSIAQQLEDPIELSRNGIIINIRTTHYEDNYNKGYQLPVGLLEILKTLRHKESGKVFTDWILRKCSQTDEDFEATTRFLHIFVNFTSFLDSLTHMELWKPPVDVPKREREFVLQAFKSIQQAIIYSQSQLKRAQADQRYLAPFDNLEKLIKLRFGEVFKVDNRTSLYTVSESALTPTPQDFAEFAVSIIDSLKEIKDPRKVSCGLVKLAESIGIEDIKPLIRKLPSRPRLRLALDEEAKRVGLIKDKASIEKIHTNLDDNPWRDASEMNFAEVIPESTDFLDFYVFTGTFGPFTRGHKDLIDRLIIHLDSLPEQVGSKNYQRIVLVVPVIDASVIQNYAKSTAQTGTIYERVASIILHLTQPDIPRDLVFITTALQPNPSLPKSLEERIRDTFNVLNGKITADLKRAGRSAGFTSRFCYTVGPDEFKWEDPTGSKLSPKEIQREKVQQERGIVIVRRGLLHSVLNNLPAIQSETGIEYVILTPGTPYSSSTSAIEEIARKGHTQSVEPAAGDYVAAHWSQDAIRRRRIHDIPVRYPSVGDISISTSRVLQEMRRKEESDLDDLN